MVSRNVPVPVAVPGLKVAPVNDVGLVIVPEDPPEGMKVQFTPLYDPEAVAPGIAMAPEPQDANEPPAEPLTVLHVIVLVSVSVEPVHTPLPLTVNVAVNEPEAVDGVKVADPGDEVFCVQDPKPPPPDQLAVPNVPLAEAPDIDIGLPETQVLILLPALAVGAATQVIFLV